ncbi:MAG: bifunctional adenosylcobinamide kinase/adenosylcobinamide-phosphate guanylyltransferase [Oleispira sp.]|nr:bifunctional adenosylcobinamide kinase/adenosylcobinamide-phosphate guanylyltransferase [Oleispira sp.]|tara:strand:+ start:1615 stop:2139 length:525 start_codon:yes stop_codon:yes gene_type:complete
MSNNVHLVLGGARSGKSSFAERLATDSGNEVVYIATATIYDDEMQERINRHVDDRPDHWLTIEEPLLLAQTLKQHAAEDKCLLVDCLTLWLTNVLMIEQEGRSLAEYKEELLGALADLPGKIILVSNEVGQGIVPMGELSRRFVDEAGWLHQDIARIAQNVTLVVAGLPMQLKH